MRTFFLYLALCVIDISLFPSVSVTQWIRTNGPFGGEVFCLAANGNNIFAGTNGGIYSSTNSGTSWSAASTGLIGDDIHTIIFSGTDIFAGSWNSGIFRSTNNGSSWTAINSGLNKGVYCIAVSPNKAGGNDLFVGTGNGIFRSTNCGASWINSGLTNNGIFALVVSDTNLFAGSNAGVFRSTDNGTIWIAANTGLTNTDINTFAISRNTEGSTNLYAGTHGGVFLSKNQGTTWFPINGNYPTCGINQYTQIETFAFAPDGSGGTVLLTGAFNGGVFSTTNNGSSWTELNVGLINNDVSSIVVSGFNVFAGTHGSGVFLSSNNGIEWTPVNSGLTSNSVSDLAIYPNASGDAINIFVGTEHDGVFLSTNNGANWVRNNIGSIKNLSFRFAFSPNKTGGTNLFAATPSAGVFLSTNDGNNWISVNRRLTRTDVNNLAVSSSMPSGTNLFAGTNGGGVFLSTDNGTCWNEINSGLTNKSINNIAALPDSINGINLFVGTNNGVFLSVNNSLNWTPANSGLTDNWINSFAVSPNSSGGKYLYAGSLNQGGVFLSTNSGTSWTAVNNGLTNKTIYDLLVTTNIAGCTNLFAGTAGGVFLSMDMGTNWAAVNTGLTNPRVKVLAVEESDLLIGTEGGGVWRRPMLEMMSYVSPPTIVSNRGLIDFDPTISDSTKTDTVIITNSNLCPLLIDSICTNSKWFTVASLRDTLTKSDTLRLLVSFTPDTPKVYSDTLYIKNNSSISPMRISLNGRLAVPQIELNQNTIDFGSSRSGFTKIDTLRITNSSIATLVIDSIYTGTKWFTTQSLRETVTKSDTLRLHVSFIPEMLREYSDTLYIKSNSSTELTKIPLNGKLELPHIIISQVAIDFISTEFGITKTDTLRITNSSIAPLIIDSIYTGTQWFDVSSLRYTVEIFDTLDLFVSFTPDTLEAYSDTLYIISNSDVSLTKIPLRGNRTLTIVTQNNLRIPVNFGMSQNYPNPFNPTTVINYQLPMNCHVILKIYDVLGQEITTLIDCRQKAGSYSTIFNAVNLPSGVYFYRLQADSFIETRKLLFLK